MNFNCTTEKVSADAEFIPLNVVLHVRFLNKSSERMKTSKQTNRKVRKRS